MQQQMQQQQTTLLSIHINNKISALINAWNMNGINMPQRQLLTLKMTKISPLKKTTWIHKHQRYNLRATALERAGAHTKMAEALLLSFGGSACENLGQWRRISPSDFARVQKLEEVFSAVSQHGTFRRLEPRWQYLTRDPGAIMWPKLITWPKLSSSYWMAINNALKDTWLGFGWTSVSILRDACTVCVPDGLRHLV